MPEWSVLHCWGVILSKGALRIIFFLNNERRDLKTHTLFFCVCTFGVLPNVFPIPKLNDPRKVNVVIAWHPAFGAIWRWLKLQRLQQ